MKTGLALLWLRFHWPNYRQQQLHRKDRCERHMGQNESPSIPGARKRTRAHASARLPAVLLHISSVPCFKFVMREKVIFTPDCVRDLFQGRRSGQLVDAVPSSVSCHRKCRQHCGSCDCLAMPPMRRKDVLKLDVFVTVALWGITSQIYSCFYAKSENDVEN